MLEDIKLLLSLSGEDKDALLNLLIQDTRQEVADYCHLSVLDTSLDSLDGVIRQIVVIKYNRIGSEGLSSESYSGINNTYIDGYPSNIIKQLNKHRKLVVL